MTNLLALPPEILDYIFSYADKCSRKNLRLTSSLLERVGRAWVFQTARISPFKQSCINFRRILDDPALSGLVVNVVLDTVGPDDRPWRPLVSLSDRVNDSEVDDIDDDKDKDATLQGDIVENRDFFENFPRRFWRLVNRLKEFPRLRSVFLRFDCDCSNEQGTQQLDAWQTIAMRIVVLHNSLTALASLPRPPRELAIRNLQNVNPTHPTTVANLTKVLEGIQSFRLSIVSQIKGMDERNDFRAVHNFFPRLSSFWLKPMASKLEHLTIYSSLYFGFYPKCDFSDVHFPRLRTLALGKYTFVHDSQLDWILSHGSTLQNLYLDDCPILSRVAVYHKHRTLLDPDELHPHPNLISIHMHASYATRWHDYLRAFTTSLPHLRHFRLGHSDSSWGTEDLPFERDAFTRFGFLYLVFYDQDGANPYMDTRKYGMRAMSKWDGANGQFPDTSEEDLAALEELLEKLRQRV